MGFEPQESAIEVAGGSLRYLQAGAGPTLLVLHHDIGLKPYLMDRLREFVEAEQAATFARLNDGYGQPLPGAPIAQRMED